jgi:hypothetical protein
MPRKNSPLQYVFVRVHADGTAIATGDNLPTQTLQVSDDLYGTPVKTLEDGVYQLMPRRLKLTLRTSDLQSLTASEPGGDGGQQHVGPAFDWPALCRVVALDMGVPTRQVTRMKLRQVVPKLEDLLYRRGRSDIKRPRAARHARKEGAPADDDLVALLAETRQRFGHTLDVVAHKIGIDTATVFRWVKRTQPIGAEHEDRVRGYLDDPENDDE